MKSYLNLVGLAFRAGKCMLGEEAILRAIRSQKAELVLIAKDAGARTKKTMIDKCTYYRVPYIIVEEDREALSHAIGKSARVAVAILDKGFSKGIKSFFGN